MHGKLNSFSINNYRLNGPSDKSLKSLQSGYLTSTSASDTVALNPINVNKSIVIFASNIANGTSTISASKFDVLLTSASVTFTKGASTASAHITYQVMEYVNVRSKQVITGIDFTNISSNVTINAVDVTKTMLFASYNSTNISSTEDDIAELTYHLTSPTNVFVQWGVTLATRTGSLQVLEFN